MKRNMNQYGSAGQVRFSRHAFQKGTSDLIPDYEEFLAERRSKSQQKKQNFLTLQKFDQPNLITFLKK